MGYSADSMGTLVPPSFERALEIPSVRAQLYGKGTARPGGTCQRV